jgi:hypothetical protein
MKALEIFEEYFNFAFKDYFNFPVVNLLFLYSIPATPVYGGFISQ